MISSIKNVAIRAASFRRVSTEEQKEYGHSLASQLSRIRGITERLGFKLVADYGGAEHAMPGHAHQEFNRMLDDAEAGKFDAIFVADRTRWSRDTVASEDAQRRLKKCRVRLFLGETEINLRESSARLMLTFSTKASENETNERLDRSAYGRIELAAKGFVTSGQPPFGRYVEAKLMGTRRIWDKKSDGTANWKVNSSEKRQVERAAQLYLNGKTWREVGDALGVDENTIRRRVAESGGRWTQRFSLRDNRPEDFVKIEFFERLHFEDSHVIVTVPVPPLLNEETINLVKAKAQMQYANRRSAHKQVLGGYIKCEICGGSIGTHYNAQLDAVYLQHNGLRGRNCPSNLGRYELLEKSVLRQFNNLISGTDELESCVREALAAEISRHPEIENQLQEAMADRNALVREHEDLYEKMKAFNLAEGGATQAKVQSDLHRLDGQIKARDEQISELKDAVKVTRLPPDFTDRVQFTLFCLQGFNTNSRWLGTWPRGQLREMFQLLFGGPTRKSHPNSRKVPVQVGIFVRRVEDKRSGKAALSWTAKGWFPQVSDQVWMDPKVRSLFQTPRGKRPIDRARLVKLIANLNVEQFRFARMAFNTSKLEGIRGRWSSARCTTTPPR